MRRGLIAAVVVLVGLLAASFDTERALSLTVTTAESAEPEVVPAVAPLVSADPAGGVARATMILIHGGGWAGHSALGLELLMKRPGDLLLKRGWRVVSIDYNEGAAGLRDVLNAVDAEVARRTSNGPLCLYGESSGAHLALVAASRLPAIIDCVIGVGTPTDLSLYGAKGAVADSQIRLLASRIRRFFGTTTAEIAAWNPVTLAPSIDAEVLLMREADDHLVSVDHSERFKAARPATRIVELESGDPTDPSAVFLHGTVSEVGRAHYVSAINSFVDRAVAAPDDQRREARAQAADTLAAPPSIGTPITWVHSIALSAARVRVLAGSIEPNAR
jgi:pimeloyl-ACP methyl ester carboxylesterase